MPRFLTGISSNPPPAVAAAPPEAVNVESDLVVILAALLCALICVVGLIAVLRCACLRRNTADTSSQSHLANKGLKKKIIHSIPKLTYTTSSCSDSECAICLNEFREKDEIRVLPHCSHAFHVACIDTWLSSHSSCPSCRHVLAVARCQRCGQFPAVSSSSSSSAHPKATGHTPHAPTFLP